MDKTTNIPSNPTPSNRLRARPLGRAIVAGLCAGVLAACAGTPQRPPELMRLQAELDRLHADPLVVQYAPRELRDAENTLAFLLAEHDDLNPRLYDHNVYLANRKVAIAEATGYGLAAEARMASLGAEREQLIAQARALETERARRAADRARAEADAARYAASRAISDADAARLAAEQAMSQAERDRLAAQRARELAQQATTQAERDRLEALRAQELARSDVEAARLAAEQARRDAAAAMNAAERERLAAAAAREDALLARQQLEHMQTMITDLEAEQTERGLVVTIDDVLFEVDRAELKPGARRQLSQLAQALREYPDTAVAIEGHTDSTGSDRYNQDLSERRAAAVRSYLASEGVSQQRLDTLGLGEHQPVASNDTAAGRQQNRRVEVIIDNTSTLAGRDDDL